MILLESDEILQYDERKQAEKKRWQENLPQKSPAKVCLKSSKGISENSDEQKSTETAIKQHLWGIWDKSF